MPHLPFKPSNQLVSFILLGTACTNKYLLKNVLSFLPRVTQISKIKAMETPRGIELQNKPLHLNHDLSTWGSNSM